MKRARKKTLSLILTLCMVLSLLPTFAAAEGTTTVATSVTVGDKTLMSSGAGNIAYATTDNGAVVTAGANENNYNIKFENGTLTLRNATITTADSDCISVSGGAITIVLADGTTNTLTSTGGAHYGIFCIKGANLTISGGGVLNTTGQCGIYTSSDDDPDAWKPASTLTINSGTINATENGAYNIAIRGGGGITINGGEVNAKVEISESGETSKYPYAIATGKSAPIYINGGHITSEITDKSSGKKEETIDPNPQISAAYRYRKTADGEWTQKANDTLTVTENEDYCEIECAVAEVTPEGGSATNYYEFPEAWNAAVGGSNTSGATFKLLDNWTADCTKHSFGTGDGFGGGGYILVPENKDVTIDLNGLNINRVLTAPMGADATDYSSAGWVICNQGSLTLKDTSGSESSGKITGGYNAYSGRSAGGILNDDKASLTMLGGQITGNKAIKWGGGVGNYGTFTMSGGKIAGNIANYDCDSNGGAGGVFNFSAFTMTGGEISGNYTCGATHGGGVHVYSNQMTVGGTAKITDNYAGATFNSATGTASGTTVDNVYLPGGTITCSTDSQLASDASIGVTTPTAPVAITGDNSTHDYSACFHSDNSSAYKIYNDATDSNAQVVKLGFLDTGSKAAFDPRNGTAVSQSAATPADPSWDSYAFDGWYTGIDGTGKVLGDTPVPGTTYYAKWTNGGKTVRTQTLYLTDKTGDTANDAEGWRYVANTKTLTLDGATIDTHASYAVILPDGSTVSFSGANNLISEPSEKSTNVSSTALYCVSDVENPVGLVIDGTGTLNATAGYAAGVDSDGINNSFGICAVGPVTIRNGTVNATGGEVVPAEVPNIVHLSVGVFSYNAVNISGGTVNAASNAASSVGINALGDINISGGAVNVSGTTIGILSLDGNAVFMGGTTSVTSTEEAIAVTPAHDIQLIWVSVTEPSDGTIDTAVDSGKSYKTILTASGSDEVPAKSVLIKAKPGSSYIGGFFGGGTITTTTTTTSSIVVNGKTIDAGKVTTTTNTDGTKNNTVEIDSTKLNAQVASADKGSSVQVTVPTTTGTASAQLAVSDIESLSAKGMSLEIKTGDTTYTVAPNAIDTAKVASELGATDTSKVPLTVTVTPVKQSDVTVAKGTQVADPVKFEVTATYDGKSVAVSTFNSYVERVVTIPAGVDPKKITTGIRVEDGEQVPTNVTKNADGSCTARVNSLTNSTYAIIYNEASFSDTVGKWYSDIVTEMASRTIVNGKTSTTFDGDGYITRAEYAAILVRALGIPEGGTSSFTDISSSDWYYGAVGAAVKYGIITGYDDGTFRPNANISRQEAMAMLQRAAKVAEYAGTTGTLTSFTDADQVAAWAQTAAQFNVGSGLIVGSDGTIRPTDSITRAEAATVVLRLLQKSGLVDIRSKT